MAVWAIVFLLLTFPFCIYATWTDLKFLKIPNIVPVSMLLVFLITGPLVLPLPEYGLSLLYAFIALCISLVVFAAGLVPGGDLKYTCAILPFVDTGELISFALFVSLCSILAVITHLLFGWVGLAPKDWASWQKGGWKRRFPVGFALSGGLLTYLAAHIIQPV
jgi:prepilin peptidase CpaA